MRLTILAVGLVLGLGVLALADSATTCRVGQSASATPTTQPANAPINKKCPIGGDDVDPKVTCVYKGQTIGFCCPDCVAEFKKNPEKYMKTLK